MKEYIKLNYSPYKLNPRALNPALISYFCNNPSPLLSNFLKKLNGEILLVITKVINLPNRSK